MKSRVRCGFAYALAASCCLPVAAGAFIQTATNGTLSIKMDDNPGVAGKIGLFMVGTGAGHPDPGKAVFYSYANDSSLGTSWITIKDDAAMTLWTNAPQGFEPSQGIAGYAIGSLRTPAATQTSLGPGFRTVYPVPGLTVTQDVVIVGATIYNTSVRHTVTVRNDGGTSRTVGVRIMWDWMVAAIDASVFREREPDGTFTRTFSGFPLPAFRRYQVSDSDVLPTFNIYGTTEGGSLVSPPTAPDELRYASWSAASQAAWDFPVTGAGLDSAIVYYWGLAIPVTLAPGESRSFTQYVTTNLDAFRRADLVMRTEASNTLLACSGERIVYTISMSNIGDGTALDVTITDTLPNIAQFEPGSLEFWAQPDDLGTPALVSSAYGPALDGPWTPGEPPGLLPGQPYLQWRVNRLAPGKSGFLRFAVTVANGSDPGMQMFHSASATYLWDDGYFWSNQTLTTVQGATLQKWSNPVEVYPGDTVRYTLLLASPCAATLYNLEVWDSVPLGADAIIPLTQGGTISGTQMVYWTVPKLTEGQSAYLSYDVRMNGSKSIVYNRGVVAYDAYRLGVLEPQERVGSLQNRTDVRNPQLYFRKLFNPTLQDGPFLPAETNVGFALDIINEHNMTLTNVVVWDSLPDAMVFASSNPPPSQVIGNLLVYSLSTVGAGAKTNIQIQVNLAASCYDPVNHGVMGFDTLPAPMLYPPVHSNDLTFELARPLLSISTVPVNAPIPAGTMLTWNLTPLNSGLVDASNVVVWDTVPARTSFDSCGGAPCSLIVTPSATIVEWTLGGLPAQSTWMVWFSVWIDTQPAAIGPDAPTVRFTVGPGCQTFTVTSYESWAQIAMPSIEVSKYPENIVVPVDGGLAYSLFVHNVGSDTSYDTLVVDTVPAGLAIAGCGGDPGWSCTIVGDAVHWTLPALPPGVSVQVWFTATVTGPTPVCVPHPKNPTPPGDGNNWPVSWYKSRAGIEGYMGLMANTSCVTAGDAVLGLETLIAYAAPPHGANQVFQITVSSTGGLAAQNITVWDTLPSGMGTITCSGGLSCTVIGELVAWTLPVMPPGDSVILQATATVYEGIGCTSYAEAAYDNPLGLPRARVQGANVCFPVLRPEIILSVRPERLVYAAGEHVTYIISWTNIGTKITDKGKVWNKFLGGPNWSMTREGWSGTPTYPALILPVMVSGTVLWDSVDPGAGQTGGAAISLLPLLSTTTCELAVVDTLVEFDYGYGSPIKVTAAAYSNPKATVTSANLALSQTVTAGGVPAGVVAGGTAVEYRITVANVCFQTFVNLVVWESVPAGAVYTGCTAPPGASCGLAGGIVIWNLPVFSGWSVTAMAFSVSITGDPGTCAAGGELIGPTRAVAAGNDSAGQPQPAVYGNRSTVALQLPCLLVDKSAPAAGESVQPVTFTIEVRNAGDDTAYAVVVTDTLPAPLKYLSAFPPATVAGAAISWSLTALAPGAVFKASITAIAPDANLDYALLNRAVARYLTATGAPRPDRSDTVSFTLSAKLGLTVSPSPYDPSRGAMRFSGLRDGARVMIFGLSGVQIVTLSGVARHQLAWNGRNASGELVAAGIYLYAVEEPDGRGGVAWTRGKFGVIR